MNELARRIHSEADARELTDAIAKLFAESLPPAWVAERIRNKVAHAGYEAVVDPSRLISEQCIADVWNKYVREIGAPDETLVNAAEVHNKRDADHAVAELMRTKGDQSIWTMPNILAMGADGKIAGRCRALEAVRIFYELDNQFMNVLGARARVQEGDSVFRFAQRASKRAQVSAATRWAIATICRSRSSSSRRSPLSSQERGECFQ